MIVAFVTGPVRSGKSRLAERLALEREAPVTYLATAREDRDDPEWVARIEHHRNSRPQSWPTLETAALGVDEACALVERVEPGRTLLVDSLGTWLAAQMSRRLERGGEAEALDAVALEHDANVFASSLAACAAHAIVVGEEVGWGLVPESAAGRVFRDVLGRLQQRIAAEAAATYLVVSGFALELNAAGRRISL